jgi:hypothetical protein
LIENREILPIGFERVIRVGSVNADNKVTENYELLNETSMPVAKVQFELDPSGRMLLMKFDRTALAR